MNKIITVRPENIIEARFSLTNKQNSIIDMMLSKIKDDDNLRYTLDVKEYESLIKTDTSNIYRDFKKAVKTFEKKGVNITDKDSGEEVWFPWFSKIHYKDKLGRIDINIDIDFKKILYEVKKKIFFDLSFTLNMKSTYSQRVFYYMKSFEDTGWRIDILEDLAYKLETPKSYSNYANMEKFVLAKAKEEINSITDIIFDYEPIKTGRKVTHIKSTIKSKNKNVIINYKEMSVEYIKDTIGDLINDSDTNKILNALQLAIKYKHTSKENVREYFKNQVSNSIDYYKNKKNIPFVAIIISSIKENWKSNNTQTQLSFNNFTPTEYDYDKLEAGLVFGDEVCMDDIRKK